MINGLRTGAPDGSTMSTYRLTEDGILESIRVAVPTDQTVACWVRFTRAGHFAYTTNKGSGSVSSFNVSPDGTLTLLASVAADTGGPNSEPIDEDITANGKFLDVMSPMGALAQFMIPIPPNSGTLKGYRIGEDGSLTPAVTVEGFPISIVGVVAH